MTPPSSGGRKPRLTLLSGGAPASSDANSGVDSAVPSDPVSSPESGSGTRSPLPSLPPRSADTQSLRTLIEGHVTPTTRYQQLLDFLGELANPTASGGFDVNYENRATRYRLFQEKPGDPIELTVSREQTTPGQAPGRIDMLRLSYLPNGQLRSSVHEVPHLEPDRGPERSYNDILRGMLNERAQRMVRGNDLFTRINDSLRALRGRYTPESQSVQYDHFVVYNGKVYSFRRLNLLGLGELNANQQLNQISIFEETGA